MHKSTQANSFSQIAITEIRCIMPRGSNIEEQTKMTDEERNRLVDKIGFVGMFIAIAMWTSLADQVRLNLMGQKGSWFFPLVVVINCSLWVVYGYVRRPRLTPVWISNAPGVILGLAAVITALW